MVSMYVCEVNAREVKKGSGIVWEVIQKRGCSGIPTAQGGGRGSGLSCWLPYEFYVIITNGLVAQGKASGPFWEVVFESIRKNRMTTGAPL